MLDSTSAPETKTQLSTVERLRLIQTLNALPSAQFEELLVGLNPPNGNIPCDTAPQAKRSAALLEWVESPIGPGIPELEAVLGMIIAAESQTAQEFLSFAISGTINSKTKAEVQAFVKLLRKKTGDDSIDVAFFKEGSINMMLTGSPEGLKKLKELFESGELSEIEGKSVNAVRYVDNNTSEARKVRLLQALRLNNKGTLASALALARDLARAIVRDLAIARDLARASDLARDLASAIDRAIDLDRAIARDLDRASALDRAIDRDLALARAIARARDSDRARARAIVRAIDRARALVSAIDRDSDLASARDLASALVSAIDRAPDRDLDRAIVRAIVRAIDRDSARDSDQQLNLKGADFTNTNLRDIDLSHTKLSETNFTGADLTGANFTGADLTGTIFTDADVTRAIFGENEGLTDAHKIDLQKRGATFLDPPSSDVPSLVLR